MAKDPAFLFYAKDFYESTRMLLPEERSCLVDLMIYQHQNGPIPDNIKRVMLYCTGVSEATLKATLEAKFKLTSEGWENNKLKSVIAERETFKGKQAINGKIGQFWKKAKSALKIKEYKIFREFVYSIHTNQTLNNELEKFKGSHEALLKALLKQSKYAIANEDENKDSSNGAKKIIYPTEQEVIDYFDQKGYLTSVAIKAFEFYDVADWHDSNGKEVKSWKQKMNSVWFKEENKKQEQQNGLPEHLAKLPEDHPRRIDWEMKKFEDGRTNK